MNTRIFNILKNIFPCKYYRLLKNKKHIDKFINVLSWISMVEMNHLESLYHSFHSINFAISNKSQSVNKVNLLF